MDRESFDNLEDIITYLETKHSGNRSASCDQDNVWVSRNYSVSDLYNDLVKINSCGSDVTVA